MRTASDDDVVTYVTLDVPGIGVVFGQVHLSGWGSWCGDETLSNMPGQTTWFRDDCDYLHPLSVAARVLRAAREKRARERA